MTYAKIVFDFKDPDEILDYELDWSDRVGSSDPITASTWEMSADNADTDLQFGSGSIVDSFTDTTTTVWLTGGTVGVSYEMVNHIVTQADRHMDQTCKIRVKSK